MLRSGSRYEAVRSEMSTLSPTALLKHLAQVLLVCPPCSPAELPKHLQPLGLRPSTSNMWYNCWRETRSQDSWVWLLGIYSLVEAQVLHEWMAFIDLRTKQERS